MAEQSTPPDPPVSAISPPYAPPSVARERTPRAWWRSIPRTRRVALVVLALVLFLAIGGVLARFLSAENVERDDILAVLQHQARGDFAGELQLLRQCPAGGACAAVVRRSAASVKRPGTVKIVSLKSSANSSLAGSTGTTRVAWTVIGSLPVVQCVRVRRSGNVLTGITVSLLSLSAPIENEADC
jgi:hypothetical protein